MSFRNWRNYHDCHANAHWGTIIQFWSFQNCFRLGSTIHSNSGAHTDTGHIIDEPMVYHETNSDATFWRHCINSGETFIAKCFLFLLSSYRLKGLFCVYRMYRIENRHRHDETIDGARQAISCFSHGCDHCGEPIYRIVQEDRSIDFNELQIEHAMRLNWIIFSLSKIKVTRTRTVRRYFVLWLSVGSYACKCSAYYSIASSSDS